MTEKTFFFLSGLPRSGSTLLASILNQNPDIYCSPEETMICDLLYNTFGYITNSPHFNSQPNPVGKYNICKSIIISYYQNRKENYIIDKCSSWGVPENLKLITNYITKDVKIICTVRPILEVLASFISLFERNKNVPNFADEHIKYNKRYLYRTLNDARCDELMRMNGPIDHALYSISNLKKNHPNMIHLVEYDDLVSNPQSTINKIYQFLNLDFYEHDFINIENPKEIDWKYYKIPDLHYVRKKVEKKSPNVKDVLSEYVISKYSNYEIWK